MKRKIMKIADTTYVVSIPLKWAKAKGLKKGDEVDVIEQDKSLLINFSLQERAKTFSVDIKNNQEVGGRYIVCLYRQGYDEYTIKFEDESFLRRIPSELAENTIGTAIISQSATSATIKDLTGAKPEEFDSLFRRTWFLILDMSKDIEEAARQKNTVLLKDMYLREKNVNQLMNYAIRLLAHDVSAKAFPQYFFTRNLEGIADTYRDLALSLGPSIGSMEHIIRAVNRHFREFYECYYEYSDKKMETLLEKSSALISTIEEEITRSHKNEAISYLYLLELVRKIRQLCSPIIEIRLDVQKAS